MNSMPPEVAEIRIEVCRRCDAPCAAFLSGDIKHHDPCSACPRAWPSRWGQYGNKCAGFGLGDAVAKVAQPIAKFIDRIAGTNIQNCGSCAQRQAALNKILPNL